VGPFRIQHINKKWNNYKLYLSIDIQLSRITNTFHINKIKPYIENDSTNIPGCYEEQPDKVIEGRWEVERLLEFGTTPLGGKSQYLVC